MMNWLSNALGSRLASQLNGDWLKVRIARSFIQRYLGEFLEEKLRLEQLNVEVSDGKAQINDLHLHVGNVNRRLEEAGMSGVELLSGFIQSINVHVPWTNLLSQSTFVELEGLELVVRVNRDFMHDQAGANMNASSFSASSLLVSESLLQSVIMNTSLEMAGELVSEAQLESTEDRLDATQSITQVIMQFLTQVCVTLTNVRVRFEFAMNLTDARRASSDHNTIVPAGDLSSISMTVSHSASLSISSYPSAQTDADLLLQRGAGRRRRRHSSAQREALFTFEWRAARVEFFDAKASFASARGVVRKLDEKNTGVQAPPDNTKCIQKHLLLNDMALYFDCDLDVDTRAAATSLYYSVASKLPDPEVNRGRQSEQSCDSGGLTCLAQLVGRVDARVLMRTLYEPQLTDSITVSMHVDPLLVLVTPKRLCDLLVFLDCLALTAPPSSGDACLDNSVALTVATRHVAATARCTLCVATLLHEDEPRPLCPSGTFSTLCAGDALQKVAGRVRDAAASGEHELMQPDGRVNVAHFQQFALACLDRAVPVDQLRFVVQNVHAVGDFLDTPRSRDDQESDKANGLLEIDILELSEILYTQQTPQSIPILRFAQLCPTSDAALRVTYAHSTKLRVDVQRPMLVELDVSIVDRLHTLSSNLRAKQLHTDRIVHAAATMRAHIDTRRCTRLRTRRTRQIALSDDESETVQRDTSDGTRSCLRTSVHVHELELRLRIPIPDRRSAELRFDWYKPHLRDESLVLRVHCLSLHTDSLFNYADALKLDADFQYVVALLELPGDAVSASTRVPIAFVCGRSPARANKRPGVHFLHQDDASALRLLIYNGNLAAARRASSDMQACSESDSDSPIAIDPDEVMQSPQPDDGLARTRRRHAAPFAKTRNLLPDCDAEAPSPAAASELQQFEKQQQALSRVQLALDLPLVLVQLPSKRLLDTLYSRLMSDVVLWQPLTPVVPPHAPLVFPSLHDSSLQSSDSCAPVRLNSHPNRLHFSLSVARAHMLAHCADAQCELYSTLRDLHVSSAVPACNQRPTHTTLLLADAALHYRMLDAQSPSRCHLLDDQAQPAFPFLTTETASFADAHAFHLLVSRASNTSDDQREMFACVIRTTDNVAANVRQLLLSARLNYLCLHANLTDNNPDAYAPPRQLARTFTQLAEFFKMCDEPVAGYEPPRTLSSVYVHLHDSKLQHVPNSSDLFPFALIVDFELLTLVLQNGDASDTPHDSVVVRLLLERLGLSLAKLSPNTTSSHLRANRVPNATPVRVITLSSLDFRLHTAASNESAAPATVSGHELVLDARGQHLAIKTCADSCAALVQTVQYLVSRLEGISQNAANDAPTRVFRDQPPPTSLSKRTVPAATRSVTREREANRAAAETTPMSDAQQRMMADAIDELDNTTSPLPDTQSATEHEPDAALDASAANDDGNDYDDDEDTLETFSMLEKPASVPDKPEWRNLLVDEEALQHVKLDADHFQPPEVACDDVRWRAFDKPACFPIGHSRCRLELAKLTFQLFGGSDFAPIAMHGRTELQSKPYGAELAAYSAAARVTDSQNSDAGNWRDQSQSLLLTLADVRFQHEEFRAARVTRLNANDSHHRPFFKRVKPLERDVLLVRSIELDDLLAESDVRKLLHAYYSDDMPLRTNSPLLSIKLLHVDGDGDAERKQLNSTCRADDSYLLKISALPVRINLHQRMLLFCLELAQHLTQLAEQQQTVDSASQHASPNATRPHAQPANDGGDGEPEDSQKGAYFKTVIFERDVLIVLDYVGGNQFDMQYGALAAVVGSLTQLRDCRFVLTRIVHERGLLGLRNVLQFLAATWYQQMSAKKLVVAFEPVSFAMRLLRGLFDLFYEPIDQFRRNRSVLTGVKRGCRSFTQSTGLAALELLCRFVQCLEWLARVAHAIVAPQTAPRSVRYRNNASWRDFRAEIARHAPDGGTNVSDEHTLRYDEAFRRSEGVDEEQLFADLYGRTHELKPIRTSAQVHDNLQNTVGAIVTQMPATVTQQAANAADSLQMFVQGIANHIDPHRKEREELKWKVAAHT